jgi:hypothetical protein
MALGAFPGGNEKLQIFSGRFVVPQLVPIRVLSSRSALSDWAFTDFFDPSRGTNPDKGFSGFSASSFPPSTVKIQLVQSARGRLQVDDLCVRLNPACQVIG